jgi:thiopeptide-type bacteriocin biosynthesis protein
LYWKLVADPSDFNSILLNIYADASWARNAFFVKYSDPEPHLRIRVIGEKNTARTIVDMNRICRRLRAEGLIHRVDLLTYERELDRYGGEEGCVLFERLSIWESRNLTELWRRQTAQGLGGKSDLLLAIGGEIIGFWLEKAGLSVEERIDFCKKGIYTGAPTSRFPRIEVTEPTIEKAKSFVHVYGENRKSLPKTAAAYLQQKPYLASVIHMSLNRLAFSTGAADSDFYRMALHMIHEKGRHASS